MQQITAQCYIQADCNMNKFQTTMLRDHHLIAMQVLSSVCFSPSTCIPT